MCGGDCFRRQPKLDLCDISLNTLLQACRYKRVKAKNYALEWFKNNLVPFCNFCLIGAINCLGTF